VPELRKLDGVQLNASVQGAPGFLSALLPVA
jgi:hypothetical protein